MSVWNLLQTKGHPPGRETAVLCLKIVIKLAEGKLLEREQNPEDNQLVELRRERKFSRRQRKHPRCKDCTVEFKEGELVRMSRRPSQTHNTAQNTTSPRTEKRMPALSLKRFPPSLRTLLRGLKVCKSTTQIELGSFPILWNFPKISHGGE